MLEDFNYVGVGISLAIAIFAFLESKDNQQKER